MCFQVHPCVHFALFGSHRETLFKKKKNKVGGWGLRCVYSCVSEYLSVHMCVYVFGCRCTYACVGGSAWRTEVTLGCYSLGAKPCSLKTNLSLTWSLLTGLGYWPTSSRDLYVSTAILHDKHTTTLVVLCRFLCSNLVLHMCSKHCNNWAISSRNWDFRGTEVLSQINSRELGYTSLGAIHTRGSLNIPLEQYRSTVSLTSVFKVPMT